jgi:hypothetical protein
MTPRGTARVPRLREESIIVIAPSDVAGRVARAIGDGFDVIAFRNVEELDRWRAEIAALAGGVGADVIGALADIGCPLSTLPHRLRVALDAIGLFPSAPPLKLLEQQWPSRRSFYRMWNDTIPESPSAFLRRVRLHHAQRLIAEGIVPKRAAIVAGFSSVDQMRRMIAHVP